MSKKRKLQEKKQQKTTKRPRRENLRKRNVSFSSSDGDNSRTNAVTKTKTPELSSDPQTSSVLQNATTRIDQPSNPVPAGNESPTPSSQSSTTSNQEQNPIHQSETFKKYLRDVRSNALSGSWKTFDYEEKANLTRFVRVASWLRDNKPNLQHLLYQGAETGYYKCVTCAEKGLIHIVKACGSDVTKFEIQNIRKHFQTKVHLDIQHGKNFVFNSEWKTSMDFKYLKLMAQHKVSGKLFKSAEFIDILMSWINEVSNVKIDAETLKKEIPDRTTLLRRLDDMRKEIKGL